MDAWHEDAALVRAIAAGDDAAFAALHTRACPRLVRMATAVTGDREAARDVAQDAFIKLLKQAPHWQPKARVDTWLYTVALRDCLSLRRRLAVAARAVLPEPSAPAAPDAIAARRSAQRDLRAALGGLSVRDRALVTLALDEERSHDEIGLLLGMTAGACRTALHRALERLKQRMATGAREATP